MQMTEAELKGLAAQLSHPEGAFGLLTAAQMHANNIGMTRGTVEALALSAGDKVLELGHGSGAHISEILEKVPALQYYGLEISELMHNEAKKATEGETAHFALYTGDVIPYADNFFTKIMTVNTLYFWKDPTAMLKEIKRVLSPEGKFCCAFALRDFMEKLPFTKYGFNLYSQEEFTAMAKASDFKHVTFSSHTEQVASKDGQEMTRTYCIAQLQH